MFFVGKDTQNFSRQRFLPSPEKFFTSKNIFYLWSVRSRTDIFLMKVFSLFSLLRNLENFTMRKESNSLVAWYRYDSAFGISCAAPYSLRVWGLFIYAWAFQSLSIGKRFGSTLFFLEK